MTRPYQNFPLPNHLREFARSLRERSTNAERLLWGMLRGRRFDDLKFRRQHSTAGYILDFYCDELRWAVELDGGQHNAMTNRMHDERRSGTLAEHGILVTRYWNHVVLRDFEITLEDMFRIAQRRRAELSSGAGDDSSPAGRGCPKDR